MDFSETVREEIAKHCQASDSTALPYLPTANCTQCGYSTKVGRIIKVLTYPSEHYSTVIVLSSNEGIHPATREDKRRLVAFMGDVNDWLDYGAVIFTQEQEEICYKTAQIFTEREAVRPTLAFMLEQHERNFASIAESVKILFGDLSKEPGQLALELRRSLVQN